VNFSGIAEALHQIDALTAIDLGTLELYVTMVALLIVSFLIGVVAVLAGVGGGVLFVPLVSSLFPIHVDFVRGAGLMVALVGSVAAAPRLMRRRFSRLRISIPLALFGSLGSIVGARLGLLVAAEAVVIVLGFFMLAVAAQTAVQAYRSSQRSEATEDSTATGSGEDTAAPVLGRRNTLSERLTDAWGLYGVYDDPAVGRSVAWRAKRIVPAMGLFLIIGVIGGMLGVGAGWANVPVLTGLIGLPVKLAAATSGLIIIANSSSAAWVYIGEGAVEPLIVAPALIGMIGGTRLGARFLGAARPQIVRIAVIVILTIAGGRTLLGALL
jgi:uncharacterized membrane protein YfcA